MCIMKYLRAIILIHYIVFVQCEQCDHHNIKQFPKFPIITSKDEQNMFNNINAEEWAKLMGNGYDATIKHKNFERLLLNARITVQNETISHIQLLDVMPDAETQVDSEIASTILKISSHIYHTKCVEFGIDSEHCAALLATKRLPNDSELYQKCHRVLDNRIGHHTFRRLLPRKYQDDFYMMEQTLAQNSTPLHISQVMLDDKLRNMLPTVDYNLNLALVQWTQFIEHDLSKPVVTSMSNGKSIECCNPENLKLQPRHRHSACAPLLRTDPNNRYGAETCLNYVRSALGVNAECTLGPPDQLNQATAILDLSQLYGYSPKVEQLMRTFINGRIKSTNVDHDNTKHEMPVNVSSNDSVHLCSWHTNNSQRNCLMAGDMRVNSNPISIAIYTLFLRNHNRLAAKLMRLHPNWSDEILFNTARTVNIHIYRRIVLNEWFPAVAGFTLGDRKNCGSKQINHQVSQSDNFQISNEFAVAAIRFYYSMMPDFLQMPGVSTNEMKSKLNENDLLSLSKFLAIKDPTHKSNIAFNSNTLNLIQQSIFQQNAMKSDAFYESAFVLRRNRTNHILNMDTLAFDIQRGRDHGLQSYIKYAEICNNIKISYWKDLEALLAKNNIELLKRAYNNVNNVDLIIGGLLENPMNGSVVGPTFSCIIGEQIAKIQEWQFKSESQTNSIDISDLSMNLKDLVCSNYDISSVPENIFYVPSEKLVMCNYAHA